MSNKRLFVTGIGTAVGKTVVSAVLVEALRASYWKPIQAGDLESSDALQIQRLCPSLQRIYPERHRLTSPMSPHAAAAIDGVDIALTDFTCPESKALVIEGAGGLMVPLSSTLLIADLIGHLQAKVVVVSRHYLGSINHTLLTVAELIRRELPVAGIVFVGNENPATETVIAEHPMVTEAQIPILGRIPEVEAVDRAFIKEQALKLGSHPVLI
jgi:dethiobiotin synthetase